jgi:hypothetical protein
VRRNLPAGGAAAADVTGDPNAHAPALSEIKNELKLLNPGGGATNSSQAQPLVHCGYRTPAHSVAVGGYADDPHPRGQAEDIGVGSLLRWSAAQISEARSRGMASTGRSIPRATRTTPRSTTSS